jgi:phytoene dehydrogenase-like protein
MPANPTVEDILAQTRLLSLEERTILLEKLRADLLQQTTTLLQRIEGSQPDSDQEETEPLYDVMDFMGIGHGTWRAVGGVDEFLKQERASWGG